MRKKIALLSLVTSISLFGNTFDKEATKKDFENLPAFKNFNTKVLDIKPLYNDWYVLKGQQETKQGKRQFDAFSDKKTIIFGSAFDLESGLNLNIKTDFNAFKEQAMYKVGNGKTEFFLITDPECPFCKDLEEKMHLLKDTATVYVFMTPDIIPSHLTARGITYYVLSLPTEKRNTEARDLIIEKDKSKILKKIDAYNISFYQSLQTLIENPNAKSLVDEYLKDIEKAFNVKLDTKEKQLDFLKQKVEKLSKNDLSKVESVYKKQKDILDMNFRPDGTPSVYGADGKKLENQFEMFTKTDTVDFTKIKELSKDTEFSVVAGKKGAPKLYYFIGTQCSACKNEFKNIDKLLENNEVHFILSLAGSNPEQAFKEIKHIYSLKDEKQKYETLKNIMLEQNIQVDLNSKKYDKEFDTKTNKYLRDLQMTFVMATPTLLDENGKKIK